MVTLQDQLNQYRANFEEKVPPQVLEVMHRATADLRDSGNTVAQKFGLVHTLPEDLRKIYLQFGIDLPKHNGDDSWTLPLAARYIIDQDAVIGYAETDADYTVRPDPEHTLEALKSMI